MTRRSLRSLLTLLGSLALLCSSAHAATAPDSLAPDPLALRGHGRPAPLKALGRAAVAGLSDATYLCSTPLRMNGRDLLAVAAVAGVGTALYATDEDLSAAIARSRDHAAYRLAVEDVGEFFEPLGLMSRTQPWLGGAAVAGWLLDVPLLRTVPVEVLESNFIVGTLRQPIEQIVHRRRPNEGEGARSFSGGSSFPSGHASVVCETAAILSHHFRPRAARALIWTAAASVCLQRMGNPVHNHWPSDVWTGAALGTWAGHTIAVRNEQRRRGEPQRWFGDAATGRGPSWSVFPMIGPERTALAVSARF